MAVRDEFRQHSTAGSGEAGSVNRYARPRQAHGRVMRAAVKARAHPNVTRRQPNDRFCYPGASVSQHRNTADNKPHASKAMRISH